MKKKGCFVVLLLACMLISHNRIFSNECLPCYANRLYLGPEIFHTKRTREGGSKQTGFLYGVHAGYDRIKRYRIYLGFDGYWAAGTLKGHSKKGIKLHSRVTDEEIEGRVGYTLQCKEGWRAYLIPFVGGGYFREINKFSHKPLGVKFTNYFPFAMGGFIAGFFLNPRLNIGIDFKAKYMIDGKCHISNDREYDSKTLNMDSRMQYEVDLPVSYQFCTCNGRLEGSLVPFYRFRHYGGLAQFPFDFLETKFDIYGIKILLGYKF